ncbi:nucleoside diphosphate kinase [Thecamonas trahens ATCC 50062]|uniref:Nucleoside diphosphate kinase n=1 Tax=Thecamonas trahens ATCC 50062 TaxID=461836 RepID=A0A0L0DTK2_THETB|nr:nucleoside diphosphate kinase [Thecamonas trahens ATCC 50062]KNC55386.1 nucleoside diphosphate kinase [Thecamonas trahens ATCC 50062]|eukprot:XP_013753018.1 nucleoside diphosphate kinase [Thecamonas trahens ATCC 50062]
MSYDDESEDYYYDGEGGYDDGDNSSYHGESVDGGDGTDAEAAARGPDMAFLPAVDRPAAKIIVEVGLKEALEEGTLQEFHEVVAMVHDTEGRRMAVVDTTTLSELDGAVAHPKHFESPEEADELTWEGVRIDLAALDSEIEALSVMLYSSAPLDDEAGSELPNMPQTLYCKVLDNSDVSVAYEAKPVLAAFEAPLEVGPRGSVVLTLNRVNWAKIVEEREAAAEAEAEAASEGEGGAGAGAPTLAVTGDDDESPKRMTVAASTLGIAAAQPLGSGDSARHSSTPQIGGATPGGAVDDMSSSEAAAAAAAAVAEFAGVPVEESWQVKFLARVAEQDDVEYQELLALAEELMVARQKKAPVRSVALKAAHPVALPRNPETFAVEIAWAMKNPEAYPLFGGGGDDGDEGGDGDEAGDGDDGDGDGYDDSGYDEKKRGGGDGYDGYDGYDDGDGYDDDDEAAVAEAEARRKAKIVQAAEAVLAKEVQVVAVTTDARGKPLELIPTTVGRSSDGGVQHKPSRRNAAGDFVSTLTFDPSRMAPEVAGVTFMVVDVKSHLGELAASRIRLLNTTGVDVDEALAQPEEAGGDGDGGDEFSDDGTADMDSKDSSGSSPNSRGSRASRASRQSSRQSRRSSRTRGSSGDGGSKKKMSSRSMSEKMGPATRTPSANSLLSTARSKIASSVAVLKRPDEAFYQAAAEAASPEATLPVEPELGPELASFVVTEVTGSEAPVVGVARPSTPPLGDPEPAGGAAASAEELLPSAQVVCRVQRAGRGERRGMDDGSVSDGGGYDDDEDGGRMGGGGWEILPLGSLLPGAGLEALEAALERSIHEIIPRFTVDLVPNVTQRLKDYKEGWDYTNVVFGFGWDGEGMDAYDEFPLHVGCMLLDERGTELATIGLARPSSVDGSVMHLVSAELREQEAKLKREADAAASAAAAAAARAAGEDVDEYDDEYDDARGTESNTAYSTGSPRSDGGDGGDVAGGEVDLDVEKIAVDLTKISDKVAAFVLVLGMHVEEELTPELDVYMRVLDQTKVAESGEAVQLGSGFEAMRYSLLCEEGHTSLVVALVTRSKETGKWQIQPVEQYYEGIDFADVLVDIENAYRETVPDPVVQLPASVASRVPRQVLDLSGYAGTSLERTLALIKPRATAAGHSGAIREFVALHGFAVVRQVRTQLTRPQAAQFYAVHKGKPFYSRLIGFMSSGPIEVLVLARRGAVGAWRTCVPALRAKFGTDATRNAVHGSDSPANAAKEIKFFFPDMVSAIPASVDAVQFLNAKVNPVLLKGLTALAKAKPAEPLEWLAAWLLDNNPNKPKCVVDLA